MSMRLISWCIIFFLSFSTPWWVFALVSWGYALIWDGYELLVIAVIIDSIFWGGQSTPLYTILAGSALLGIAVLKPRIRWYTT
jgi:hypothetical protein